MSERMTPIPFKKLLKWVIEEYDKYGTVFGVAPYRVQHTENALPLFRERLEMPFGPAAGPNTQLAENIIAAYAAGARFFELKTVQKMDGAELAACIARPCILAADEGYNCEWSTELYVKEAMEEYIEAWVILKLISRRFGLGDPSGFMFNMSVGYDLQGIKTEKIDTFINTLKDASTGFTLHKCIEDVCTLLPEEEEYIRSIDPHVCSGVTVSTLHGCPPQEIEAIASYLITNKKLNTFVKCNPTILGYEFARKTLDSMGYDYIAFDEHHFNEDLQYADAVPMFTRLMALAGENGVEFGLKLSNTFPVDVKAHELPSEEMYMSGKALYPLTVEMANRIAREFSGKLRISFSGGAEYFNIKALFDAGIAPITVATTVLKPGGYSRFTQLAKLFDGVSYAPFTGVDADTVNALSLSARTDVRHMKAIKPLPRRKREDKVPLMDCFTAPCKGGCPISQDIPEYIELCGKGRYDEALALITEKNPLPFITGTICAHRCMDRCTRNFYDTPVSIRATKLEAAEHAYDGLIASLSPAKRRTEEKTAVIGGGPAGLAAAYFLAREGFPVTVFEKENNLGGTVKNVIPAFRISDEAIDKDVALVRAMGAEFVLGAPAPSYNELKAMGYSRILLAVGAMKRGDARISGNVINVIDFLYALRHAPDTLNIGSSAAVIGGGNSAMDAARALKRMGVARVSLVYRRTKKYMPADEEELRLAIEDGVEFMELLAPIEQKDGALICHRMKLGEPDQSGRRAPVDTGETCSIPADTVIAAVGEKPDSEFLASYGVTFDESGRAHRENGDVFTAGDALRGPATVVEAIADARAFADTVAGEHDYDIPEDASVAYNDALAKKPYLCMKAKCEAERCLDCSTVCETCATVCPNRANIAVALPGHAMREILHVDYLCNECGNCESFCPYDSAPYKEKFTYFRSERDFLDSANSGFMLTGEAAVRVRLDGAVKEYDLAVSNDLPEDVELFILTVIKEYGYIL